MINVIIPAAGRGQRFVDAGVTTPKESHWTHNVNQKKWEEIIKK